MSAQCPISQRRVDGNVARLNGFVTFAVMLAAVLSPWHWLSVALAGDLFVRAFVDPELSVSGRLIGTVLTAMHVEPKPTNAGPKMFAAKIAFVLAAGYAVLYVAGAPLAAAVLGLILAFCSGLEAFVGFCLGCWMYQYIPHRDPGTRRLQPLPVAVRRDRR
jgi:hypothetical protein